MALATSADVELALGRALRDSEVVDTLLEEASDRVVGYLGQEPDPVPPAVVRVVASMVAAVLKKPAVTTADYGAGGYNAQREVTTVRVDTESTNTTGPWLTKEQKKRINRWRLMQSIQLGLES